MVEEILGVLKKVPVPRLAPPLLAAYQFNVPALAVAPRETIPVPQRLPGVVPVMVGIELMLAITPVLDDVQPPFVAST